MTELALRDTGAMNPYGSPAPQYNAPRAIPSSAAGLIEWGHALAAAGHMADLLCDTEFVPRQWRGKKAECAAAIMTGAALGMDPLAALRAMDSIQGTPAFRANTLRGLVQAHGHEIWVEEANSSRAIVKGRRKGSSHIETSVWTIDRARQLGLVGKDNWKKQPQVMLIARGTSEIARLVAADVLLGVPYAVEELDDGGELEAAIEPTAAPAKRTARRAPVQPVQETAAEIAFDPEPDQPAADPPADLLTPAQSRKMHAQFQEAQLDRDAGLNFVAELIGHPVDSTKGLTKAEATKVIDALAKELGDDVALLEDPFPSDRGAE